MSAGGKIGSIGVWKGAGANFPAQCPSYSVPRDYVSLHFCGAVEEDFLVPSWRLIHSYIYSGVIYAFG